MIEVVAAIIENEQGKILIARRKPGKSQEGLWEFPGGKKEAGESDEQCLRRELLEEMEIKIEPYQYFDTNDYVYGETLIRLIAYKAKFLSGKINLHDHDRYEWVRVDELLQYSFAPADVIFVDKLLSELN